MIAPRIQTLLAGDYVNGATGAYRLYRRAKSVSLSTQRARQAVSLYLSALGMTGDCLLWLASMLANRRPVKPW
jgi:hypothetical protein